MYIADRITAEPDKLNGKPCIRGLRIRVTDVLELVASGMTIEEIVADYPDLEPADIPAALRYAAARMAEPVVWASTEAAE